jgi:hypothetical protein
MPDSLGCHVQIGPELSCDFTFTFWLPFNPVRHEYTDMGQATLDDEELFTEAASEMRDDVETSLAQARDALPAGSDIWDVDADNTLGVLNAMRSALDVEGATENLRDAKKWYTMGEKADAFDDADDLAADIEAVEALIDDVEAAREQVGDLTSRVPQLKSALEDVDAAEDETEADSDAEPEPAEA